MSSIFDAFLSVSSLEYYAKDICKSTGAKSVFCYYTDIYNGMNELDALYYIPEKECNLYPDNHISKWLFDVPDWRRTFQLNCQKTIKKQGLIDYVLKHKELKFHLTVKGYRVLYIMKFSFEDDTKNNETILPDVIYKEEDSGQLSFIL